MIERPAHRTVHQFAAVLNSELVADILAVRVHSVRTDVELLRDPALRHLRYCLREDRGVRCETVPSFFMKQMALCAVQRFIGCRFPVANQLDVAQGVHRPVPDSVAVDVPLN